MKNRGLFFLWLALSGCGDGSGLSLQQQTTVQALIGTWARYNDDGSLQYTMTFGEDRIVTARLASTTPGQPASEEAGTFSLDKSDLRIDWSSTGSPSSIRTEKMTIHTDGSKLWTNVLVPADGHLGIVGRWRGSFMYGPTPSTTLGAFKADGTAEFHTTGTSGGSDLRCTYWEVEPTTFYLHCSGLSDSKLRLVDGRAIVIENSSPEFTRR